MDPVATTPTEHRDYAAISAVYASLLGTLIVALRARDAPADGIPEREIPPLGAATFALAKAVSHEKVETWLRAPFLEEPPEGGRRPRGTRLRYAIGELLACTRCLGAWSALGLVALRLQAPRAGRVVTTVLAVSATNDWLQGGFALLRARANEPGLPAEKQG